ncbi:hypothetical protein [Bosea sp. UC22_33]|uniref:hypothetical protein n=1 Tax=Bosea sp. UC22_33 TaxID=3350165 RepID=UPI00366C28D7
MALSGVHFACGFGGGTAKRGATLALAVKPVWSETMASPGTTSGVAPQGSQNDGDPIIGVSTSVAVFVAFGPAPNASTGPRVYIDAGDTMHFSVAPGDKAAWIAA